MCFNLAKLLKRFKYYNLTFIIQFNITHKFAQLNRSKNGYVPLTIQLNISHLLHTILMTKISV